MKTKKVLERCTAPTTEFIIWTESTEKWRGKVLRKNFTIEYLKLLISSNYGKCIDKLRHKEYNCHRQVQIVKTSCFENYLKKKSPIYNWA